ncbi:MAG: hypothetical protein A2Y12_17065 [Planctomycetes bacterium GWF2_42_9]|nr:MAG: hypothetical protein A2Y12_17065 [Planctomycetes bacterium GWF2_42_9]
MSRSSIRKQLKGYIPSIRTCFDRNGDIDFEGLGNQIEFCIEAGAKAIMLTAGDSHYICLSDEEILEITRLTCQLVKGRALVIAADRYHSTERACKFADICKEMGADIQMCLPPDWGGSCTDKSLAEHYVSVSKVMPVMIVTNIFLPRGVKSGLNTIEMSLNLSKNIVAIKDDMCGDFARQLCLLAYDRCAVIAGGQKQNHINMWPFGCDGYLSTFLCFKPRVSHDYWKAIETNDLARASKIIGNIDIPFFEFILSLPGGFDAGIHGALELFGIAKRWRRSPYYSLNDQEMDQLRNFFQQKNLL